MSNSPENTRPIQSIHVPPVQPPVAKTPVATQEAPQIQNLVKPVFDQISAYFNPQNRFIFLDITAVYLDPTSDDLFVLKTWIVITNIGLEAIREMADAEHEYLENVKKPAEEAQRITNDQIRYTVIKKRQASDEIVAKTVARTLALYWTIRNAALLQQDPAPTVVIPKHS